MRAKTNNITIRMDAGLKKEAEELFADLGMNFSTAFNLFVRQAIRKQGIPFAISQNIPNRETQLAIAEGMRIMYDPKVKGYTNMDDFIKAMNK